MSGLDRDPVHACATHGENRVGALNCLTQQMRETIPDTRGIGKLVSPFHSGFGRRMEFAFGARVRGTPTGVVLLKCGRMSFASRRVESMRRLSHAAVAITGEGRINGSGRYRFLVSVSPWPTSGPELIRVKLWDVRTGTVVYDTQRGQPDSSEPSTPIESGSIEASIDASSLAGEPAAAGPFFAGRAGLDQSMKGCS